jgi:hypothetical protein
MDSHEKILPHGDFKEIDDRLWTLDGELPHTTLPRTMTVFKMDDGGLWIHSAIALNEETQKKLESFGRPKFLVVPNTMHRLDAPHYKNIYPSIQVVCPQAAIEKVQEKVLVDDTCENAFRGSEIKVHSVPGVKPIELAYELPLAHGGKGLVINDLIVNVPELKGVSGWALKILGRIGFFRTPPMTKLILLENKEKFKNWLLKQSQRKDIRIITLAHGRSITEKTSELLMRAARLV